jgi:hypothetical protein
MKGRRWRRSMHKEGKNMQSDGFLITRLPQPRLDWTTAAVRFSDTRAHFLKQVHVPASIIGIWSVICLPFKGMTNRKVECLEKEEIAHMILKTREMIELDKPRRYDRNHEIEVLFRNELEYPPYSLDDNWDGHTIARRHWAEHMYRHSGINI